MHKTLTSVVALAGLAAAGAVQAEPITLTEEQSDAVVAGDSEPMELSLSDMDGLTAGYRYCFACYNTATITQNATATANAYSFYYSATAVAVVEQEAEVEQSINSND